MKSEAGDPKRHKIQKEEDKGEDTAVHTSKPDTRKFEDKARQGLENRRQGLESRRQSITIGKQKITIAKLKWHCAGQLRSSSTNSCKHVSISLSVFLLIIWRNESAFHLVNMLLLYSAPSKVFRTLLQRFASCVIFEFGLQVV